MVLSVIVSVLAGLGVRAVLTARRSPLQVTWPEFVVGALLCAAVVAPAVSVVGTHLARSSLLEYQEFWGGFETAADWQRTTCTKDGRCRHTYQCDPYVELVTRTRTVSDGNGGTRTETYTEPVTRYHDCPWATQEWTFVVGTTLGDYTVAAHVLPDDVDSASRWRGDGWERRNVPARLSRGVPPAWQAVHDRVAAGTPGPVTKQMPYDNYLLASDRTILHPSSDALDGYLADGLLPLPAGEVTGLYTAAKLYPVGDPDVDVPGLSSAVARVGAALGVDRQGDLHMVVADAGTVDEPDRYVQALRSHWLSAAAGRTALAKNAVAVVVGVDDDSVVWARAFTGMPVGNEELVAHVAQQLPGVPVDPATLVGDPHVTVQARDEVTVAAGTGALEQLLFAASGGFQRACMTCQDDHDSDVVGFAYLADEIEPTGGQRATMAVVAMVVSAGVWAAFALLGTPRRRMNAAGRSHRTV